MHSHKLQSKFYKISKFSINGPNSKQDTAIWKCQNVWLSRWADNIIINGAYFENETNIL